VGVWGKKWVYTVFCFSIISYLANWRKKQFCSLRKIGQIFSNFWENNFMPWKKLARAVSNAPSWNFLVWKLASSSCFHFGTGFRCATVLKAADSRVKKSFSMYLMYILCTIPQVYGRSFRPFTAFSKSCCLPLPGIV
jgi:hypothetical protein